MIKATGEVLIQDTLLYEVSRRPSTPSKSPAPTSPRSSLAQVLYLPLDPFFCRAELILGMVGRSGVPALKDVSVKIVPVGTG